MSVNTSSSSDSFIKEYVIDVIVNLPRSRIYRDHKIVSIHLDIMKIMFLKSGLGNSHILYSCLMDLILILFQVE